MNDDPQPILTSEQRHFVSTLALPAFYRAAQDVISDILNTVVHQGSPISSLIKMRHTDQLADQVVERSPGAPEISQSSGQFRREPETGADWDEIPTRIELEFEATWQGQAIRDGNFKSFIDSLILAGLARSDDLAASALDLIRKFCEVTGNTSTVKIETLTHDDLMDQLERLHFDFDDDLNPKLKTIIGTSGFIEAINKLPPPTPEQRLRWERIVEGKRNEWLASKRSRRIPAKPEE